MNSSRFTLVIATASTAFAMIAGATEPTTATITKDEAKRLKACGHRPRLVLLRD